MTGHGEELRNGWEDTMCDFGSIPRVVDWIIPLCDVTWVGVVGYLFNLYTTYILFHVSHLAFVWHHLQVPVEGKV